MTRASFLSLALLSLILPSCNSVSLGGSEEDAGTKPGDGSISAAGGGGSGGTGGIDAPVGGQGGGGTSGTGSCAPRTFDADCYGGATIYTCVQRGGQWVWDYRCPELTDGGSITLQHPSVSTGAACIDYPTSGYRVFPYNDPSIQYKNGDQAWPRCTHNCNAVMPVYGAVQQTPLDQALPAGSCDDEGATCSDLLNEWCAPCANVGGPGNGYVCVCRGHNWHCSIAPNKGLSMCGPATCLDPSRPYDPLTTTCRDITWSDTQVCACGVCRDLCDSDAQCPSGRCKLNQVCKPSTATCPGPDECPAPCRGLCEPAPDGGTVDTVPATGCDVTKAAQALSAAGITTVGEAQTTNMILPSNLSIIVYEPACRAGGYELTALAGKTVCLASFATTALCQRLPATAWVVMSEGTVRCIYQSASLNPGIYSVHDSLCSTPDAGVPSCPGPNPALRTCRSFANECIPSVCNCGSPGYPNSWSCTADCPTRLPLCADGGAADDGGACSGARIDNTQAATALAQYIRQRIAGLNPATTFGAEEKTVPNLWDTMQAQLFFGKMYAEDGSIWQEVAFLYRKCAVTQLTDDLWFGLIQSGVVANGAFYYSWIWGSGISRTSMGKMTLNGETLVRTTSAAYPNLDLVVALENEQLVVYQAVGKFNEWQNTARMGVLKDYGDRLAVVDGDGKELSTTLP